MTVTAAEKFRGAFGAAKLMYARRYPSASRLLINTALTSFISAPGLSGNPVKLTVSLLSGIGFIPLTIYGIKRPAYKVASVAGFVFGVLFNIYIGLKESFVFHFIMEIARNVDGWRDMKKDINNPGGILNSALPESLKALLEHDRGAPEVIASAMLDYPLGGRNGIKKLYASFYPTLPPETAGSVESYLILSRKGRNIVKFLANGADIKV